MNRRSFLAAAAGGALAMNTSARAADAKSGLIELSYIRMRNTQDAMAQRTNDFLAKSYLPALQRAGAQQMGAFSAIIGSSTPSTILLSDYPDAATWEAATRKIRDDKDLQKAAEAFYSGPLPFVRLETALFRGFPTVPMIEPLKALEGNRSHVFELRTYESNSPRSLARKIRMFEEGEIALFRKIGMKVVFFGEALTGQNLPQLTYMLAFDDASHRDKAWGEFASHPDWTKMKNMPGVSDGEVVSSISNTLLRPLPFSGIR